MNDFGRRLNFHRLEVACLLCKQATVQALFGAGFGDGPWIS